MEELAGPHIIDAHLCPGSNAQVQKGTRAATEPGSIIRLCVKSLICLIIFYLHFIREILLSRVYLSKIMFEQSIEEGHPYWTQEKMYKFEWDLKCTK